MAKNGPKWPADQVERAGSGVMRRAWVLSLLAVPASASDLTIPRSDLTPGLTRALSLKKICSTKWGRDVRHVTNKIKLTVYHNYGLSGPDDSECKMDKRGRKCEIDHLIPRSLGGADNIKNLWPQPYGTMPWNAVRKDRLETKLSREVCSGRLSLAEARAMISPDYRPAYLHYFGKN